MAKSPESPGEAAAAKALAAEMAEEARQALNDYAATVPHPEFAELGYAVRMRTVRKGVIHRARLTLLLETREGVPEYRTLAGAPRGEAELSKEPAGANGGTPRPNCTHCQGTGWIRCEACGDDLSQPKAAAACPRCHGTGEAPCRACHGAGTTSHRSGKWTVKRKCSKCLGSGQSACEFCRKAGACRACGGTHRVRCECVDKAGAKKVLPLQTYRAGIDVWDAERPSSGFQGLTERWRWDGEEVKLPCPVCGGTESSGCKACDGKGQLLASLNVSRELKPATDLRYVSALPCPRETFAEWEQAGDFEPECEAKVEGAPDPAFWPAVPKLVAQELLDWAEQAAGETSRVVRHQVEVSSARAVYATYTYKDTEYACWLLGSSRRLLAPSNPITERLDADLATIHELVESGDVKGASELLARCRAMGKADPHCQKRLDEIEAEIEEHEAGGGGKTWAIVATAVGIAALAAYLGYRLLT